MSLSRKFREFRRETARLRAAFSEIVPRPERGNRWNATGRTRRKLAEILTAYVQSILGANGKPRYPGAIVKPEDIHPMRLVGKARLWEDAHSWDATATWPNGDLAKTFYSFSTMTACVRAGRVLPVGKDGEVSI